MTTLPFHLLLLPHIHSKFTLKKIVDAIVKEFFKRTLERRRVRKLPIYPKFKSFDFFPLVENHYIPV